MSHDSVEEFGEEVFSWLYENTGIPPEDWKNKTSEELERKMNFDRRYAPSRISPGGPLIESRYPNAKSLRKKLEKLICP